MSVLAYYIFAVWMPFVALVHRGAVWLVPLLMVSSTPMINPSRWTRLLACWIGCSVLWTPEPLRALHVAGCAVLLLLVCPTQLWYVPRTMLQKSTFLAFLVFAVCLFFHDPSGRSVALKYAPLALTFSFIAAVSPTRSLIMCSFLVAKMADCDTAMLATLGVALAQYIPLNWLKKIWKGMWVLVVLMLCFIKTLTNEQIQSIESLCHEFSYVHRIYIYREVGKFISRLNIEQQTKGMGLDSSRFVGQERVEFKSTIHGGGAFTTPIIPVHPHNIILQITLELGIVGLILVLVGLWRVPFHNRPQMLVGFVAAGHALMSIGIWQTWWMATAWAAYWLSNTEEITS